MSRFFTYRRRGLTPYTPGEQPKDRSYIKLNTNESPFPPPRAVAEAVAQEAGNLQLYSDPEALELRRRMAKNYRVDEDMIVMVNGSDEILNFAFMAFADDTRPLAFPDITYGFYPVFAKLNHIPFEEIPLRADFSVCADDYVGIGRTVVLANPNAPTGLILPLSDVEKIVRSNPDNMVIVDEAYIDFGGESAVTLLKKYDNLLVTGTFSKSRSMAGARLGFGFAHPDVIRDINTIRYSTNPYNVNRLTARAGVAALENQDYFDACCRRIIENRAWTTAALQSLGFTVLPSSANFVFAKCNFISGEKLYLALREKGVLIRHFDKERIKDYNRITVGTAEQMHVLIEKIKEISEENT
ncbi:MAG: histidinol-phosphate transaminase [Clostridia bacterium]|nr:histidinol-phosphate transaminase [Clostridia bacterium]